MFWPNIYFWPNIFFHEFFLCSIFFWPKISLDPNIFSDKNIFLAKCTWELSLTLVLTQLVNFWFYAFLSSRNESFSAFVLSILWQFRSYTRVDAFILSHTLPIFLPSIQSILSHWNLCYKSKLYLNNIWFVYIQLSNSQHWKLFFMQSKFNLKWMRIWLYQRLLASNCKSWSLARGDTNL